MLDKLIEIIIYITNVNKLNKKIKVKIVKIYQNIYFNRFPNDNLLL